MNGWLRTAPSTNLNAVAATGMAIATGCVVLLGILINRHPEPITFGIWCGFLAGWKGINMKQFGVKRNSDWRLAAVQRGAPVPDATEGG